MDSLPVNERLMEISETKKGTEAGTTATKQFEEKVTQLENNQVIVPKSIKLMQEYESSVGKEKSLIPEEHYGMISYGTKTQTGDFSSFYQWEAMIIGPQEVFIFSKLCKHFFF